MIGLVDGNNFFVSCERVFNRRLVGRPVAVLSNNDGCCVSRSNEFKALGIPMGTPYFQLKHREASGELCFCSSNYELYGDMSRRIISILREEAVDVEQYSIDEAFIFPPTTAAADYAAQAAAKLRRHGLLAAGCNIYAQVFASGGGGDFLGRTVVFPAPTDATNEMLRAIRGEVDALYVAGTRYRKTGIVFFGLEKPGTARQTDLFDTTPPAEK